MDDESLEEMCIRRRDERIAKLEGQIKIDRLANLHLAARVAIITEALKSVGTVRGVSRCWCRNPLEFCRGEPQCVEARILVSEIPTNSADHG